MKNRKKANIILGLLMLSFIVLAVLKHYLGEPLTIRMLIFIVEAALVGSIADWFAVTALFERPMGFPIKPIIPSNREKILSSLSNIVNNHLLDMNYIQHTIEKLPISETLIGIIDDKPAVNKVKNLVLTQALNALSSFRNNKIHIARFINYIKGTTKDKDIDSIKTKVLKIAYKLIQKHFTKAAYCSLIDKAIMFLKKDSTYIKLYNFLDNRLSEKTGNKFTLFGRTRTIVDTDELAKAIQSEGIDFLRDLKASDKRFNDIKSILNRYSEEYLKKADLKKFLDDLLDNIGLENRVSAVLTRFEALFTAMSNGSIAASDAPLQQDENLKAAADIITGIIKDIWKAVKNDPETLSWIDSIIKELIIEIIAKNRTEFSGFIEQRIKGFTDEQLTNLIQNSAGEALHWIRINGAMLGAMLGIVLFSFINFLYEPLIIPLAHKLTGLL